MSPGHSASHFFLHHQREIKPAPVFSVTCQYLSSVTGLQTKRSRWLAGSSHTNSKYWRSSWGVSKTTRWSTSLGAFWELREYFHNSTTPRHGSVSLLNLGTLSGIQVNGGETLHVSLSHFLLFFVSAAQSFLTLQEHFCGDVWQRAAVWIQGTYYYAWQWINQNMKC